MPMGVEKSETHLSRPWSERCTCQWSWSTYYLRCNSICNPRTQCCRSRSISPTGNRQFDLRCTYLWSIHNQRCFRCHLCTATPRVWQVGHKERNIREQNKRRFSSIRTWLSCLRMLPKRIPLPVISSTRSAVGLWQKAQWLDMWHVIYLG